MTIIETIPPSNWLTVPPARGRVRPVRGRGDGRSGAVRTRPLPARPGGAPLRYRGSAVPMSRAPHRRQPRRTSTPATTIGLALLAALTTVWLGLVAQFGASAAGRTAAVPDELGVVRVQDGESLQRLAARVAPSASTREVVARIRELNQLDSAAVDAGQTLIAPIG